MKSIESEQAKAAFAEAQKAFLGKTERLGLEGIDDVVVMIKGIREGRENRKILKNSLKVTMKNMLQLRLIGEMLWEKNNVDFFIGCVII